MTGAVILGVLAAFGFLGLLSLRRYVLICPPNEALVFSGRTYRQGNRSVGYRLIKGGRGFRLPLLESVARLDLTNMIIEVSAKDAYSKGGIPLSVQGVANVKIAGHQPVIDHAVVRFLDKPRADIMKIAKATLEGSLRGVLASMTPEQVNADRQLFAERLVHEVEHDMTVLGLAVDTLKIQHVHDEVKYLDSIGRKKNAEMIRSARIAEAEAQAAARINSAQNREAEAKARIAAATDVARADAEKRLTAALSQREALIAEERATVGAQVAQVQAGMAVQRARVEQVRHQLEAEVVEPAKAACLAAEARAKADAAPIVADGKARADVLLRLSESWRRAGPHASQVFVLQKLPGVIARLTEAVGETSVEQLTVIGGGHSGDFGSSVVSLVAALQEVLGGDLASRFGLGGTTGSGAAAGELPAAAAPAPAAPLAEPRTSPPAVAPAAIEYGPLDLPPEPIPRPAPRDPRRKQR